MPAQVEAHVPSGRPLWSLLEDTLVEGDGDTLTVHGRWGAIEVPDPSPVVREALHRMSLGPVALENISWLHDNHVSWKSGTSTAAPEPCPTWRRLKSTLDSLGGCVVPSLGLADGAGPILSVVAVAGDAVFRLPHVRRSAPIGLPGRSEIQGLNGDQALTCPGMAYQVVLHRSPVPEIAKLLLDRRSTAAGVAESLQLDHSLVGDVVAYFAGAGLLTATDG